MKKNIQDSIDKYLLGKLSGAELSDFEKQVNEDSELAEEVRLQQGAFKMIDLAGDERMRATIKKVHTKMHMPSKRKNNRRFLLLASAAAVLAVFLIWNFFIKTDQILSPEKAYAAYFEPLPMSFAERGGGDKELVNASMFYSKGEYEEAISIFEKLNDDNTDTSIDMALGISLLEEGEYKKAISIFEELILTKDPFYEHHAYWYAALGYLKLENFPKCKDYLSLAAQKNPSIYKMKVEKLLSQLPPKVFLKKINLYVTFSFVKEYV